MGAPRTQHEELAGSPLGIAPPGQLRRGRLFEEFWNSRGAGLDTLVGLDLRKGCIGARRSVVVT